MQIRTENISDHETVYAINASAFETDAEAKLVDALRAQAQPYISLVAEEDGNVVGHIMFSPVTLSGHPDLKAMGLAPMSVMPELQRSGIGSALVRAGLKKCVELGFTVAVVLGHPEFYPRFGFVPSTDFGIDSECDVPEEVFMAMELQLGALTSKSGRIAYHPAFAGL